MPGPSEQIDKKATPGESAKKLPVNIVSIRGMMGTKEAGTLFFLPPGFVQFSHPSIEI